MAATKEPLIETEKKEEEDDGKMGIAVFAGLIMAVIDANDMAIFSFMPTYYMQARKLSYNDVGISWALISVGIIFFAPLVPAVMGRLGGAAKTYYYGLAMYTLTRVFFCLADLIPDNESLSYLHANEAIFFFTGITYAFGEIGCAAWVLSSVGEADRSKAFAKMMEGRTLGALGGPPLGGALYSAGQYFGNADLGWNLPFLLGGLAMVLLLKFAHGTVFNADCDEDGRSFGFEKGNILKSKKVLLTWILNNMALIPSFFFWTLLQPWLEEQYNFGPWKFGLATMVTSLIFIVGAEVAPKLQEKFGTFKVILTSYVFVILSGLCIGPSPLLPFLPAPSTWSVWLPILGLFISTLCNTAPCAVLLQPLMMKYAEQEGFPESVAASQTAMLGVAGMGFMFIAAPFPATFLATTVGTPWASTLGSIVIAAVSILIALVLQKEDAKTSTDAVSKA
jgi:MFS family permease